MSRPFKLKPDQLAALDRIAAERRAAKMIPTNAELAQTFGCSVGCIVLAIQRANRRAAHERSGRLRQARLEVRR